MATQLEGLSKMEEKLRRRELMTTFGEVTAGLAHDRRDPLGINEAFAGPPQNSAVQTEMLTRRLGDVVDQTCRIDQESPVEARRRQPSWRRSP